MKWLAMFVIIVGLWAIGWYNNELGFHLIELGFLVAIFDRMGACRCGKEKQDADHPCFI